MITLSHAQHREIHRQRSAPTYAAALTQKIEQLRMRLHTLRHPSGQEPILFREFRAVIWDLQHAEALLQKNPAPLLK